MSESDAGNLSGDVSYDDLPTPEREAHVHPDELHTDGENPNEMSDDMFGQLVRSMRRNGWLGGPIITDTDGLIADGEHRWRAAMELGLDEVPVRQFDIDDSTRRLWRQQLNKIHGEHDPKRDALEYDLLLDSGHRDEVYELTKAADEDLDDLLDRIRVDSAQSPGYEYPHDPRVHYTDCVEGMREQLDDDSVDLVFTSPPYNVGLGRTAFWDSGDDGVKGEAYDDDMDPEEYRAFLSDVMAELARVVKPDGHVFFNIADDYAEKNVTPNTWVCQAAEDAGLPWRSFIVWNKDSPSRGVTAFPDHGRFLPVWEPIYHFSESDAELRGRPRENYNVWTIPPSNTEFDHDTGDHPAPFPVALVKKAIDATTEPDDLVLDPFLGSGTTAVAAIETERDFIGFELDEDDTYQPIIERRIQDAIRAVEQQEAGD